MVEYSAAVLRARVWTLTVRGCGVVHLVEELEKLAVRNLGGVVGYLEGFGVYLLLALTVFKPNKNCKIYGDTYGQSVPNTQPYNSGSSHHHRYILLGHRIIPFP